MSRFPTWLPVPALLLPFVACGGIVERSGTSNAADSGPLPSPSASASASPAPSSSPSPPPSPLPSPPPPAAGESCWSPGPPGSGGPISDTPCSFVGTWDFTSDDGPTGSFSFDSYGNWVGGASGADLCAGSTMQGTYTFDGSTLEFVTIHDSSVCHSDWIMTFTTTFDATCASATLMNHIDNCTGGHQELGPEMTLTKR